MEVTAALKRLDKRAHVPVTQRHGKSAVEAVKHIRKSVTELGLDPSTMPQKEIMAAVSAHDPAGQQKIINEIIDRAYIAKTMQLAKTTGYVGTPEPELMEQPRERGVTIPEAEIVGRARNQFGAEVPRYKMKKLVYEAGEVSLDKVGQIKFEYNARIL